MARTIGGRARQVSDYAGSRAGLATFFLHSCGAPQTQGDLYSGVAPGSSTKREIEVKLRIADVREILSKLRKLRAISRGRVLEQNTLYDTPNSEIRRSGRLLRLRTERPAASAWAGAGRPQTVLTLKGPLPGRSAATAPAPFKERMEREVLVHSPQQWPSALGSLGLRPAFRYDKYRTSFRLGDLHLDLDETPIGVFLELEGPPAPIDRAARLLGFSRRHYLRQSYGELYIADCRRQGRVPRNMLFRR